MEFLQVFRKRRVFLNNLTLPKVLNLLRSLIAYVAKRPEWVRFPVHVKVDVAPSCQLRCPVCPHSYLPTQPGRQMPKLMKRPLFEKLVDDISRHTIALSMYDLGEPLLNSELPDMITYASSRMMNTYITTNLSLPIRAETIKALVAAKPTLLLVAVDGISPETFGQQRIGGDLKLVTDNLRAIAAEKVLQQSTTCIVCLQYLVFDFNRHEKKAAKQFARSMGVDELHFIEATTSPWLETYKPKSGFNPLPDRLLPRCAWPYFSAVVHGRGDVLGCCKYRMTDKYLRPDELRSLGNLKEESFETIYRSQQYHLARSMVSSPTKTGNQPNHFCSGCGTLYGEPVVEAIPLHSQEV
ncbi:radical SAM/SPASM domain-containing protein [Skermanella stibiiresistens]|uniref:radical SAM/SPASM domain-containing protein n=1 Tax=Skermanella stibiiresistens TaxID=913326 RepID=UPI0018DBF38D|nr:SPASM domain-containing protein [Skermanella stibiiresistens]